MSIWNKILIGLIFVASGAVLYMGSRSMKMQINWRTAAQEHQQALALVEKENAAIVQGDAGDAAPKGILQLRRELHRAMVDRGRVWRECDPRSVGADGAVKVGVSMAQGAPHGIGDKMRLYLFEAGDVKDGGRFLGEFKAVEIGDREVGLQPTYQLSPEELQRLTQSQGRARQSGGWTMYEEIPTDDHALFAGLPDEQYRAMLPDDVVAEYLKDGKPADASDPEDRQVDGKYVRPLRHYGVILESPPRLRTEMAELRETMGRDTGGIEKALADAKRQESFARDEIDSLKRDLNEAAEQRKAVDAHLKEVEERLAQLRSINDQQIAGNQAMAGRIAKLQLEASRQIDLRTGAMAQAGTGAGN